MNHRQVARNDLVADSVVDRKLVYYGHGAGGLHYASLVPPVFTNGGADVQFGIAGDMTFSEGEPLQMHAFPGLKSTRLRVMRRNGQGAHVTLCKRYDEPDIAYQYLVPDRSLIVGALALVVVLALILF